tara:strand:- start:416 stop:910 length:495 start_codon:yes stop_codon:yes gene_type:complete
MTTNHHTSPETKAAIVDAAGIMYAIGANWQTIRTELYRQTTRKAFDKWNKNDLPSQSTLERWMKADAGVTSLEDLKNQRIDILRTKLQRKAISMALGGDRSLLIFSLKNLCDWSDKHAIEDTTMDIGKNHDLLKSVPRKAFLQLTKTGKPPGEGGGNNDEDEKP